ncbi:MAG: hypothetical protein ACYDHC_04785 [Desulfuromonadaceae bacterium]
MLAQKTAQQQDGQKASKENAVQSIAGDKVSIKIELPQKTVDTLQNMGNISDFLNSVATNLRQTNEGLTAANAVAEQMKASLDKIIKNFPPYSIDSKERIDQLMQYSSLRKQIMSLMTPPPPQPVYDKVKHLWEGLASGIGGVIQTPSLPQDAPDSHVSAASKQLEAISGQIALVQETMSNSVMRS